MLMPLKISTASLLAICKQNVQRIFKKLSTKKSARVDIAPPKLVKIAADCMSGPPSQSINNIEKVLFQDNAKFASIIPR